MSANQYVPERDELLIHLRDARDRTRELVAGLSDEQLIGPRLAIVNPLRWETGHVAWFHEFWVLRHHFGEAPLREDGDRLYDSAAVAHDSRWDLPLPTMADTLAYGHAILERVADRLSRQAVASASLYFGRLGLFHEDMHDEAFTYTRQTLGYAPPPFVARAAAKPQAGPLTGDVEVPGGAFTLGATPDLPFVFDNEKWGHPVTVAPFRIARAVVTQGELAEFVEAAGYERRPLWSAEGWAWREREAAAAPFYWERADGGGFCRRVFDRSVPLAEHEAAVHVNAFEAEAYCRWKGRRLPTEAEWELAASGFEQPKRRFPWGDDPVTPEYANLDGHYGGTIDVAALAAGDSPFGCRQMIGNVWEWTATRFGPYPGFVADPYKEYSEPWFHTPHRVLRGGCWVTRGRLLRNTWRNFYEPHRRDAGAGFRTCALAQR